MSAKVQILGLKGVRLLIRLRVLLDNLLVPISPHDVILSDSDTIRDIPLVQSENTPPAPTIDPNTVNSGTDPPQLTACICPANFIIEEVHCQTIWFSKISVDQSL